MQKKLLALLLSLSLVASLFACIPMSAAAAAPAQKTHSWGTNGDKTVTVSLWGAGQGGYVAGDYELLEAEMAKADENFQQLNEGKAVMRMAYTSSDAGATWNAGTAIQAGHPTDATESSEDNKDGAFVQFKPDNSDGTDAFFSMNGDTIVEVYGRDGSETNNGYYVATKNAENQVVRDYTTTKAVKVAYYQDFGARQDIYDIVISTSTNDDLKTGYYELYAANSYTALLDSSNLIYTYKDFEDGSSMMQRFHFDSPVKARYVAMVVYAPNKTTSDSGAYEGLVNNISYYPQPRISTFKVYGVSAGAGVEGVTIPSNVTPAGKDGLLNDFKGTIDWYQKGVSGVNDATFVMEVLPTKGSVQVNDTLGGSSHRWIDYNADGVYETNGNSSNLGALLTNNDAENDKWKDTFYSAQKLIETVDIYANQSATSVADRGELVSSVSTRTLRSNRNADTYFINDGSVYGVDSQGAYIYADSKKTYRKMADGVTNDFTPYVKEDLTYYLGEDATVTDIMFGTQYSQQYLRASNYQIFVGNNKETLYSSENMVYQFVNDNNAIDTSIQHIQFEEALNAKYVGFLILNPTNGTTVNAQSRISLCQIWGSKSSSVFESSDTYSFAGVDTTKAITRYNSAKAYVNRYKTSDNSFVVKTALTAEQFAKMTDFTYTANTGHVDIGVIANSADYYYDLVLDFECSALIKQMTTMSHRSADQYLLRKFDFYLVEDLNDMATASPVAKYDCEKDGLYARHVFTSDKGISAKYAVMRIYSPAAGSHYARLKFNAYGDATSDFVSFGQVDSSSSVEAERFLTYKNVVDITDSLIGDKKPENRDAFYNGKRYHQVLTDVIDQYLTSATTVFGNCNWRTAVKPAEEEGDTQSEIFWKDVNGNIRDDENKYYQEVIYNLGGTANITSTALFGHYEEAYAPSHYKVSFANTKADLFTDNAYTVEVKDISADYTAINLLNPVTAKYVGLRIICGITPACGLNYADCYSRIAHFSVFGEMTEECVYQNIENDAFKVKDATCTTGATYYKSCAECGNCTTLETFVSDKVNPENHTGTIVTVEGYPATCQNAGLTDGQKYNCCDAVVTPQTEIEVDETAHIGNPVLDTEGGNFAATHTTAGWENKTVYDGCGHVADAGNEIPALGHVGAVYHEANDATCKDEGNVAYYYCPVCEKNYDSAAADAKEIADVVIPVNPDAHIGEAKDEGNYPAGHTTTGWAGKTVYECGHIATAGQEVPATGHEDAIHVEYKAPTCMTAGNVESYYCPTCEKSYESKDADAKVIEVTSLGTDPNNHEQDPVLDGNYGATATQPGLENRTIYPCCGVEAYAGDVIPALGHTVKFFDKNGTEVYTAQIQDGETAAAAAEEALKVIGTVVGYTFKGWDNDVNASVNGEANFTATYKRDIETKYQTSINGEPVQEVAFDTKITVKAGKKSLWKINGHKYHIGETVVAYSFGNMAITAEDLPADVDENKAFVSLLEVKKTSGELVAFVHVYAGAEEVAEYGANFWNVSTSKAKNIVVTAGADAMITLYGIKAGAQRGVKAYAKVNGVAIYSEKTAEYTF